MKTVCRADINVASSEFEEIDPLHVAMGRGPGAGASLALVGRAEAREFF